MSRSLNRLPYSQQRGKRFDQFSNEEEDRENFASHTQDNRRPMEFSALKNRTPFHSANFQEQNESKEGSAVTHNKFKRPIKDQNKSLKNYQEKYNRLEQNFKRFTASMMEKKGNRSLSRHSSHRFIDRQHSPMNIRDPKVTLGSNDDEGLVGSPRQHT